MSNHPACSIALILTCDLNSGFRTKQPRYNTHQQACCVSFLSFFYSKPGKREALHYEYNKFKLSEHECLEEIPASVQDRRSQTLRHTVRHHLFRTGYVRIARPNHIDHFQGSRFRSRRCGRFFPNRFYSLVYQTAIRSDLGFFPLVRPTAQELHAAGFIAGLRRRIGCRFYHAIQLLGIGRSLYAHGFRPGVQR